MIYEHVRRTTKNSNLTHIFSTQEGNPTDMTRTGRISQQPTENSNHDNGNDDDLLYDIKCCNPSDDEPDDILLTSDEESDQESDDIV